MCIFLHIDKVRTSTNHPQANGGVERFNRTLAQMLTMYCQNKQRSWDEYLPQVMMAYRSAMHSTTHYSPNKMLFGREIMLPLEVMVGHPEQENKQNKSYCEYIQHLGEIMEEVHELARKYTKRNVLYQKKQYDLHAKKVQYFPGQLVWLYDHTRKKGICQKLKSKWRGPYLITKKIDDLTYLVKKTANGMPKAYHVDSFMPYKGTVVPKWTKA
jgi:hypothetical protein